MTVVLLTTVGAGTWTVPAGVTSIAVKMVAGGGAGGSDNPSLSNVGTGGASKGAGGTYPGGDAALDTGAGGGGGGTGVGGDGGTITGVGFSRLGGGGGGAGSGSSGGGGGGGATYFKDVGCGGGGGGGGSGGGAGGAGGTGVGGTGVGGGAGGGDVSTGRTATSGTSGGGGGGSSNVSGWNFTAGGEGTLQSLGGDGRRTSVAGASGAAADAHLSGYGKGGAGHYYSSTSASGAGGGGGFASIAALSVTPGESIAYAVGGGGKKSGGGADGQDGAIRIEYADPVKSVSVSEDIDLDEAVSLDRTRGVSVSDSPEVADSVALTLRKGLSVSEGIGVGESVALGSQKTVGVSEGISAQEELSLGSQRAISVAEGVNVAEAISLASERAIAVAEGIPLDEDISLSKDGELSENIEVEVGDAITLRLRSPPPPRPPPSARTAARTRPVPTGLTAPRTENTELNRFAEQVASRIQEIDKNAASLGGRVGRVEGAAGIVPGTDTGPPNLATPPQPLAVQCRPGIGAVFISWANPFRQYRNHARALIYRHTADAFDQATQIGQSAFVVHIDDTVEDNTTYYYWVRFESTGSVLGLPSDSHSCTSALDPAAVYQDIADWINSSPLAAALTSKTNDATAIVEEIRRLASGIAWQAASSAQDADDAAGAVAVALTALSAKVTTEAGKIAANAAAITAVQASLGDITQTCDRLTMQLSTLNAGKFAAQALPGSSISIGPSGAKQTRTVYTIKRTGNRFVLELQTGVAWGSGAISVPTGTNVSASVPTNVSSGTAVDATGEWHVAEDVEIPATASAVEQLEARVTLTEDVDGNTTLSQLARWLVKTTVGDLIGGIGLYNDGTNVDFIVVSDRFAILPTGVDTNDSNYDEKKRIPFAVHNGIVYLDIAAIRDASITGAKIEDATITGTLLAATAIADNLTVNKLADLFNVLVNGRISSSDYVAGTSGFKLDRSGAEFNAGIQGNLWSSNYDGKVDPADSSAAEIGTAGWLLNKDGKMVVDLARVRGTLTADHIESDVLNWVPLWNSSGLGLSSSFKTITLLEDYTDFDQIAFSYQTENGFGIGMGPTSQIQTSSSLIIGMIRSSAVGSDAEILVRRVSDTSIKVAKGPRGGSVYRAWGVKFPGSPPAPGKSLSLPRSGRIRGRGGRR